jgi:hypothetical protein
VHIPSSSVPEDVQAALTTFAQLGAAAVDPGNPRLDLCAAVEHYVYREQGGIPVLLLNHGVFGSLAEGFLLASAAIQPVWKRHCGALVTYLCGPGGADALPTPLLKPMFAQLGWLLSQGYGPTMAARASGQTSPGGDGAAVDIRDNECGSHVLHLLGRVVRECMAAGQDLLVTAKLLGLAWFAQQTCIALPPTDVLALVFESCIPHSLEEPVEDESAVLTAILRAVLIVWRSTPRRILSALMLSRDRDAFVRAMVRAGELVVAGTPAWFKDDPDVDVPAGVAGQLHVTCRTAASRWASLAVGVLSAGLRTVWHAPERGQQLARQLTTALLTYCSRPGMTPGGLPSVFEGDVGRVQDLAKECPGFFRVLASCQDVATQVLRLGAYVLDKVPCAMPAAGGAGSGSGEVRCPTRQQVDVVCALLAKLPTKLAAIERYMDSDMFCAGGIGVAGTPDHEDHCGEDADANATAATPSRHVVMPRALLHQFVAWRGGAMPASWALTRVVHEDWILVEEAGCVVQVQSDDPSRKRQRVCAGDV